MPRRDWTKAFLDGLRKHGTTSGACQAARINRSTAHRRRVADPEFAAQWDETIDACVEQVEATLLREALKPGRDRDRALYLRAHRPGKYNTHITPEQVRQIKDEARRELVAEFTAELVSYPVEVQRLIVDAIKHVRERHEAKQLPEGSP